MQDFRSPLRKKAELLYRKYRAILIFTSSPSKKEREALDETLAGLADLPKRDLQIEVPKLAAQVDRLSNYFGLKGTLDDLEAFTAKVPGDYPVSYILKAFLQNLFTHYEKVLPSFIDVPPHGRIGINLDGSGEKGKIEVFILEASLYEDMASLWNLAFDLEKELRLGFDKELFKRAWLSLELQPKLVSIF